MAETEGAGMSVRERIAALKLQEVGRVGGPKSPPPPPSYTQATNQVTTRPRPPPPPRPTVPPRPNGNARTQSVSLPPLTDHVSASNGAIGNLPEQERPNGNANGMDGISRPALPPRTSTQSSLSPALPPRKPSEPSPALPPRRPSETPSQSSYSLTRRDSNESVNSIGTTRSSVSGMSNTTSLTSQSDRRSVRAPSYDPSSLPVLPPKRSKEERDATYYDVAKSTRRPLKSHGSSPSVALKQNGTTAPPTRRPSAQSQPALPERSGAVQTLPPPPPRQSLAEPPKPRRSALEMGMNSSIPNQRPVGAARSTSVSQIDSAPPPVPKGSRPDLAALQASKPKPNGASTTGPASTPQQYCLQCRDFSAADAHAARFPRESIPNQDVGWLAQQLTAPFPSLTDKARAIFTWLHHNVMYDTQAFFSGNIQPSTPQSTLASGWAVCEGYAGLYAALAVKAGLEAYVIGGDGKGYGYTQLKPGDPLPPFKSTHAWNAVKIDGPHGGTQWKLIDPCWGAGHICGSNNLYKKAFAAERFTQSNEEFGLDHFPEDTSQQYRNNGRTVTWEQYITANKDACGALFFGGYVAEEGLSKPTFTPVDGKIVLANQGPTVRFSFQKVCPHWDPMRNGKGPYCLYILHAEGLDGTQRNHIPFETNGTVWWCDLPVADLGRPGQKVYIQALKTFDGRDARGLSLQEYRQKKNRVAQSWSWCAKWEVA